MKIPSLQEGNNHLPTQDGLVFQRNNGPFGLVIIKEMDQFLSRMELDCNTRQPFRTCYTKLPSTCLQAAPLSVTCTVSNGQIGPFLGELEFTNRCKSIN